MNNLNSVLLEGNLTRDPELRYTARGTAVCRFSIACNRSYKQEDQRQEEVSYFDVTTWSRLAEICAEYLVKGRGVRVVGRLKQDRWEDDSGNRRARVEVIAEHVEFKPQRRDQAETAPEAEAILPEPEPAQATA